MRVLWRTAATTTLLWNYGTAAAAAAAVTPTPKAISIGASQFWDGNDGPWSSFPIRVGNPPQDVRVFPSTLATSTLVVGPSGCQGVGIPANCTDIRGGIFAANASSSWKPINGDVPYELHLEGNLGYGATDEAIYGNDTVTLGFAGSGGPTVQSSTVGWLQTPDFWVGVLGLSPRPTNFTDFDHPQRSYLDHLYRQGIIPSLSYGYTAGAQYMYNGVLGSLTLGGYDAALVKNNVSFPFNFDQTRDLTVGVQLITASQSSSQEELVLAHEDDGFLALVDSSVAQMWLPLQVCQAFEAAFNLTYDNITQLYLVNETQHNSLMAANRSVSFTLAPTLSDSSQQVNITLPYVAFDLEVLYPLVPITMRYFPLRRAMNSTQYTLGRVFLQEAYITVDYLRRNFSISQRLWSSNPTSSPVSILPPLGTPPLTSITTTPSKISRATIAGICVGAAAALIVASLSIWLSLRYNRRIREEKEAANLATRIALEAEGKQDVTVEAPYANGDLLHEMSTKKEPMELVAAHSSSEVDGSLAGESRPELSGVSERFELEAPHGHGELSGTRPVEIQRDLSPLSSTTLSPPKITTLAEISPLSPEYGIWPRMTEKFAETKSLREIKDEPKSLLSMKDLRGRPDDSTSSAGPSSRGRD